MTVEAEDRKQRCRRQAQELRDRLNRWDPIGVIPRGSVPSDGLPLDEYDCLHGPILEALGTRASASELATMLRGQLLDHFGLPTQNDYREAAFAAEFVAWYGHPA